MKRYFKHEAESERGKGVAFIEFDEEWATRQVERYNGRWFNSTTEYHPEIGPGLVNQPLSEVELGPEHEISKDEFEEVWLKSLENTKR